jgi:hypothetical protein
MRNRYYFVIALIVVGLMAIAAQLNAQQQKQQDAQGCPMQQQQHSEHDAAEMNRRGAQAMGFSQTATTHHFRLSKDGGQIEVEANDVRDSASRDQIRMHLWHIAASFAAGDFEIPMLVHAQTPPGVPVMRQLKDAISYKFEETERGGRVLINTNDAAARAAVHEFLRFQITEHHTGDPLDVPNN